MKVAYMHNFCTLCTPPNALRYCKNCCKYNDFCSRNIIDLAVLSKF